MSETKKVHWTGFKSRLDIVEEKISKLEDVVINTIQSGTQEKNPKNHRYQGAGQF